MDDVVCLHIQTQTYDVHIVVERSSNVVKFIPFPFRSSFECANKHTHNNQMKKTKQ